MLSFFGILQRIYVFSASTQRWTILQQHAKSLSVKASKWHTVGMSHWKRQGSHIPNCWDAWRTDWSGCSSKITTKQVSRSEAESLCKELESFRFIVVMVFWHDILFRVNYVSKVLLQICLWLLRIFRDFQNECHSTDRQVSMPRVLGKLLMN